MSVCVCVCVWGNVVLDSCWRGGATRIAAAVAGAFGSDFRQAFPASWLPVEEAIYASLVLSWTTRAIQLTVKCHAVATWLVVLNTKDIVAAKCPTDASPPSLSPSLYLYLCVWREKLAHKISISAILFATIWQHFCVR